jgi:hypothetical protein
MNHFRKSTTVTFDESLQKYLPSYPLVWTPPKDIRNKYTPFYDVLVTHYFESDLISLQDIGFLCLNQSYGKSNKAIVMDSFAKKASVSKLTIVKMIDRLQDLELLDRVCRTAHKGYPVDLVLRPPQSPATLENGGIERLRSQLGKTNELRQLLGKDFPLNRFSEKLIVKSLGRKSYLAKDFHKFCILENHRVMDENPKLTVDSITYKNAFLPAVYRWCESNDLEYKNDAIVRAALDVAENYGRRPIDVSTELAIAKHKKNVS